MVASRVDYEDLKIEIQTTSVHLSLNIDSSAIYGQLVNRKFARKINFF